MPKWKETILTDPDWPEKLDIPQTDSMPEGSEAVLESMFSSEHWEWELWRQPDGKRYFLKVWPMDEGKFSDPKTPGIALTVAEAFQFLMTNWMPQVVLDDHFAEHGKRVVNLPIGSRTTGLN